MRSRIINWSLALVAVLLLPQVSKAQIAASNPLEWIALAEGNELIKRPDRKTDQGTDADGTPAEQHCRRIQPHP